MARVALIAVAVLLATPTASGGGVPRWPVWLCGPRAKINYCDTKLTTTVVHADGSRTFTNPAVLSNPPVDCFYVYPSVSTERRPNSDLVVHSDTEGFAAVMQAGRFGHVCRVYAPMYHQVTGYARTNGIAKGDYNREYEDVLAAWRDYMAHDNHGRGVILLGHSEGSWILQRLLREQYASVEKVFVSALLAGGAIPAIHDRFGSIPACRSKTQTSCIAGWATWGHTPPKDARGQSVASPANILCVNPAAPAGGSAPITPLFTIYGAYGVVSKQISPPPKTVWVALPDLYVARCVEQGQRSWLLVTPLHHPGDKRELAQEINGPQWGYHPADINIVLDQLVALAGSQAAAWVAGH